MTEPTDPLEGLIEPTEPEDHSPLEKPGNKIGPYRLLQVLGSGGMGEVWLAERREPYVQRVALKVVKPGMDTKAVLSRFEQERQVLAQMSHPNIAKVLDAGVNEQGRPYFVMEYVPGKPITEFADEQKLSIQARLEYFLQVCNAIAHAHQKGVIHRDIKPGNILVSRGEIGEVGTGSSITTGSSAKVIDFGVAKAMAGGMTQQTVYTQIGEGIGTWGYMSPEQIEGDTQTPSDVYSLGVLLYELMCGEKPYDISSMRNFSPKERADFIRGVEIVPPSKRLLNSTPQQKSRSISAVGQVKELRELDWVCLKALSPDLKGRFLSVHSLAEDVQRFISGEQVEAAPVTFSNQIRRYWKRNAGVVVSLLSAVTLVVAGSIYVVTQNRANAVLKSEVDAKNIELQNRDIELQNRQEELEGVKQNLNAQQAAYASQKMKDEERISQKEVEIAEGRKKNLVKMADSAAWISEGRDLSVIGTPESSNEYFVKSFFSGGALYYDVFDHPEVQRALNKNTGYVRNRVHYSESGRYILISIWGGTGFEHHALLFEYARGKVDFLGELPFSRHARHWGSFELTEVHDSSVVIYKQLRDRVEFCTYGRNKVVPGNLKLNSLRHDFLKKEKLTLRDSGNIYFIDRELSFFYIDHENPEMSTFGKCPVGDEVSAENYRILSLDGAICSIRLAGWQGEGSQGLLVSSADSQDSAFISLPVGIADSVYAEIGESPTPTSFSICYWFEDGSRRWVVCDLSSIPFVELLSTTESPNENFPSGDRLDLPRFELSPDSISTIVISPDHQMELSRASGMVQQGPTVMTRMGPGGFAFQRPLHESANLEGWVPGLRSPYLDDHDLVSVSESQVFLAGPKDGGWGVNSNNRLAVLPRWHSNSFRQWVCSYSLDPKVAIRTRSIPLEGADLQMDSPFVQQIDFSSASRGDDFKFDKQLDVNERLVGYLQHNGVDIVVVENVAERCLTIRRASNFSLTTVLEFKPRTDLELLPLFAISKSTGSLLILRQFDSSRDAEVLWYQISKIASGENFVERVCMIPSGPESRFLDLEEGFRSGEFFFLTKTTSNWTNRTADITGAIETRHIDDWPTGAIHYWPLNNKLDLQESWADQIHVVPSTDFLVSSRRDLNNRGLYPISESLSALYLSDDRSEVLWTKGVGDIWNGMGRESKALSGSFGLYDQIQFLPSKDLGVSGWDLRLQRGPIFLPNSDGQLDPGCLIQFPIAVATPQPREPESDPLQDPKE